MNQDWKQTIKQQKKNKEIINYSNYDVLYTICL